MSLPTPLLLKEGRALAPIWLAAAATILVSAQAGMLLGGLFAFVVGTAALGAFSIGHEYAHRTLTTLLAQPLARSRLLLSKVVVLAPLLVLLSVVAGLAVLRADGIDRVLGAGNTSASWRLAIVLLTPALGLCVAPWLTMVCRSVMAGLVFTLAIPAGLWITGQIARAATVGFSVDPLEYSPALPLMIGGVLLVTVAAVVHGQKLFAGLEALEAPRDLAPAVVKPAAVPVAEALRSRMRDERPRPRHPISMLVRKEVRFYLLPFAVTFLYALGWVAMRASRTDMYIAGQSFEALSQLYGLFIAVLVGAVSSEERALGTAEWQILQPYAFWKQWMVKATMVIVLALMLGFAVPILLEAVFPLIRDSGSWVRFLPYGFTRGPLALMTIAIVSFYVSTLCAGGLRALMLALPFSFSLALLYGDLQYAVWRAEQAVLKSFYGTWESYPFWWLELATSSPADFRTADLAFRWIGFITLAGFIVLTLVFAFRNSRSAERGTAVARKQVLWLLACVILAAVIRPGAPAFLRWWLLTH